MNYAKNKKQKEKEKKKIISLKLVRLFKNAKK